MEKEMKEVLEIVNFIKDRMVTKDEMSSEFAKVHEELAAIRAEIKDLRARVGVLEEKFGQQSGFAKEIDYVLSRIAAIEHHLGVIPSAPKQ